MTIQTEITEATGKKPNYALARLYGDAGETSVPDGSTLTVQGTNSGGAAIDESVVASGVTPIADIVNALASQIEEQAGDDVRAKSSSNVATDAFLGLRDDGHGHEAGEITITAFTLV